MSKAGNDSESCGPRSVPCKSIAQAVRQVDWGGHIYIDGKGTDKNPYDCNSAKIRESNTGMQVQKSLHMEGLESTPHVSCIGGLKFLSNTRTLSIVLSGIVFRQTPLSIQDCNFVKILNCSFLNSHTALTVGVKNIASMQLDIQSSSYFENNTSCVEVFVSNTVENRDQFLGVNVSDTSFFNNGRLANRFARGAVTLKSEEGKNSSIIHVQISFFKIAYINNRGQFINLDIPAGTTNEEYRVITFINNTVSRLTSSSGRSTNDQVNSLYTSSARKISAQFSNFTCSHNHLLRCIKIVSDEALLKIWNSSFVGQTLTNDRGAAVFLESKTRATLRLSESRFRRNRARQGGALFVESKDGIIKLNIAFVNFTECSAKSYGSAISVGDPKSDSLKNGSRRNTVTVHFKQVRVQKFYGKKRSSVLILLSNGNVTIRNSTWNNSQISASNALTVQNTGGKTNVTISGCTFIQDGPVRVKATLKRMASGSVTVKNCLISNQRSRKRSTLYLSQKFKIKVSNVTFDSNAGTALSIFNLVHNLMQPLPVDIYISNCTFNNNSYDIVVHLNDPTGIKFTMNHTALSSRRIGRKYFGIYFSVDPLHRISFSNALIELDNVTFDSRPSNIFALQFPGKKTLTIRRSKFRSGICFRQYVPRYSSIYTIGTGAISVLSNPDKLQKSGCITRYTNENTHSLWNYDSDVIFEDVLFEGNVGLIAGAVYISNGNVTFNRCTFRNNFGTKRSGHVYSAYGTGRVVFKDCTLNTSVEHIKVNKTDFDKSAFLFSESGGPILFQNTTMVSDKAEKAQYAVVDISNGGYIYMDDRTTIECRQGSQLLFENYTHFAYSEKNCSSCLINVTGLKYSCSHCPVGLYSLQKGVSRGFNVQGKFTCLPCPYGANCTFNIASKPNFWGFRISNNLSFFACPEHYCQSPTSNSKEYNSCYGNRTGFLCGRCAPGYSESLLSTECCKSTRCNNYILWIIIIVLTTGFTIYLLIKPPILSFLGRHTLWFRKKEEPCFIEDLGREDQHSDPGYIKIIFYFYQAAELLIVGSTEDLLEKFPFIFSMVAAFNLQARTPDKAIDCPFAGLRAVTKELLLSVTVFLTISEVVVIYCLNFVVNKIRRKERPSLSHYMAVVIVLLLLGYKRLAKMSLKLITCVPIGSENHLFIDGTVVCWKWWQWIPFAYIIVSVVPFIIVLYCGSSMLYKASISSLEFLGACIFPLPFLIYWSLKKFLKICESDSLNPQANNKDVSEILHGPFRQPTADNTGTLYWESILIGRRFTLLAGHAFITNSMLRMVFKTITCVLILLHHVLKNPFHDPIANKAETFSLLTLVVMAVINLTKATLISFGTSIDGPTKPYLEHLELAEVCVLMLAPALLSIFIVVAIFSQMMRLVTFLAKKIYRCLQRYRKSLHFARHLERPVLDFSEED